MGLDALAHESGSPVVALARATGRGNSELVGYDEETGRAKWRLRLEGQGRGIVFADADTFPLSKAHPWRESASSRVAVVVDREGRVVVVDRAQGHVLSSLGPFGEPHALCAGPSAIALSVDGALVVIARGAIRRFAGVPRASALAFSGDMRTIAVGTADGRLLTVAIDAAPTARAGAVTLVARVNSAIADVVATERSAPLESSWLVADGHGVAYATDLLLLLRAEGPPGVQRIRFDAFSSRLAVQNGARCVVVYDWPSLTIRCRLVYDSSVTGLAFGTSDSLSVGLDDGIVHFVDVVTTQARRTERSPVREERSWQVKIHGKADALAARQAEEALDRQSLLGRNGVVARGIGLGAGVVVMIAYVVYKVLAVAGR